MMITPCNLTVINLLNHQHAHEHAADNQTCVLDISFQPACHRCTPSLLSQVEQLRSDFRCVDLYHLQELRKRSEADKSDKTVRDLVLLLFETALLASVSKQIASSNARSSSQPKIGLPIR
jgi:hypothetical protein